MCFARPKDLPVYVRSWLATFVAKVRQARYIRQNNVVVIVSIEGVEREIAYCPACVWCLGICISVCLRLETGMSLSASVSSARRCGLCRSLGTEREQIFNATWTGTMDSSSPQEALRCTCSVLPVMCSRYSCVSVL
jgi:hypothetical protein